MIGNKYRVQAVLVSLVAALLLLLAADRYASLSGNIMALYGFGGGNNVSIVLTEEGMKTFKNLGLTLSEIDRISDNRIKGVQILSSVGSEYLLSLNGVIFTIPKTMVVSRVIEISND